MNYNVIKGFAGVKPGAVGPARRRKTSSGSSVAMARRQPVLRQGLGEEDYALSGVKGGSREPEQRMSGSNYDAFGKIGAREAGL